MSETAMVEPILTEEKLRTETSALFKDYKAALMTSPAILRALGVSFFGSDEKALDSVPGEGRKVGLRLDDFHHLEVKYDPNRTLSAKLTGKGETTSVDIKPGEPLVHWKYKNDDGRRKEKDYSNTMDAIGQSRFFLVRLKNQLGSSV